LDPSQKKSKRTHHQTKGPVLSLATEVNQNALEGPWCALEGDAFASWEEQVMLTSHPRQEQYL